MVSRTWMNSASRIVLSWMAGLSLIATGACRSAVDDFYKPLLAAPDFLCGVGGDGGASGAATTGGGGDSTGGVGGGSSGCPSGGGGSH